MKAHVADWKTRVYCVRLAALNGTTLRFSAHPTDLPMSNATVYLTGSGYEFSGLSATSSFSASSVDFAGFVSSAIGQLSREEVASGVWDNARAYVFATSWYIPIEDEEPCAAYTFGKAELVDDRYKIEFMALIDALSQSPGYSYSATCQNVFLDRFLGAADKLPYTRSGCTGPRSAPDGPDYASLLVTGTITSVTDQYYIADSARTEVDDYFGNGAIRFITGANAGLKPLEIKAYTQTGGVIFTQEAWFYMPEVGDQYEMIPGCRKRLTEDCVGKWNNALNLRGHPHIPAPTQYNEIGRQS
ncbi:DUF2163 domain-containing protein [Metapseudomonas resinovorans]|uniref:DUF2163 domain-containing protein n=1 Tax=Metapseudomonas resinovorans TaxID=53412 RepID=UPI0003F4B689|nr:DUF2163 domain-containing protein [Pseudomonas resinovorans]